MHLPHDLVGQPAKLARKESAEAVSIFNQSGVIKEYGVTESGNGIQCFLPVAHGDALNLSFDILSGEEQIVDILVDGIVREIIFNSRVAKIHRGKVVKVCACERRPSGVKGKLEHCDMVVQNRSTLRGNCIPSSTYIPTDRLIHFVWFGLINHRSSSNRS